MTPTTATAPDPFDPAAFRLSGEFAGAVAVKKVLTAVPVRKPDKAWFVRAHPDEKYRLQTAVIELKEDRETYLVPQHLCPELAGESTLKPMLLVTAVNRQGWCSCGRAECPVRMGGSTRGASRHWRR